MKAARAGLALGSNLGDRRQNLDIARVRIESLDLAAPPFLRSRLYESPAAEAPPGSPDFLNAVLEIGWRGEPLALLHVLRAIERALGRPTRYPRNSPRVIDLDILYLGDLVLATDELTLPHPRMTARAFVMEPLADIRPDLAPAPSPTLPSQSW